MTTFDQQQRAREAGRRQTLNRGGQGPRGRRWASWGWVLVGLTLLGVLLRGLGLNLQPLWWDEGYSVYFATEPLAQMLVLTARDIHPPLYYALLHGWLLLWGSADPAVLRGFSVLVGGFTIPAVWWVSRILFPGRTGLTVLVTGLIAINPMHLFYSQEVRMYGLELLFGLLSVGFFWAWVKSLAQSGQSGNAWGNRRAGMGYLLTTTALLYTEYYGALIPFALFLWALVALRHRRPLIVKLIAANGAVALLFLPWLLFAVPELLPYISQKIVEDGDRPLGPLVYLWRHAVAFVGGHIQPQENWIGLVRQVGTGAAVLLLAQLGVTALANLPAWTANQPSGSSRAPRMPSPVPMLAALVFIPVVIGFVLNLRLPFFPEGGERLLFVTLPYVLMLVGAGVYSSLRQPGWLPWGGNVLALLLLGASVGGVSTFYSVPRYVENDYRSLIRQTVEQGGDEDTVFVVFPWQMGYWRAYAPVWGRGALHGPRPILSPQPAWGPEVAATLETALLTGKLWFPAHLSLGGVLEGEIESYLMAGMAQGRLVNFVNRWISETTRLSAWAAQPAAGAAVETSVDYGPVRLVAAGDFSTVNVASANQVIGVSLTWQITDLPGEGEWPLRVVVRLQDEMERVWAERSYEPIGSWVQEQPGAGTSVTERVGLLIPAGVPPGPYQIAVGVGQGEEGTLLPVVLSEVLSEVEILGEQTAVEQASAQAEGGPRVVEAVPVGALQVMPAEERLPVLRLPIQERLPTPITRAGVDFLGFSGYDPGVPTLAGTELALSLFVQNQGAQNQPEEVSQIYVSLLDDTGRGVAGWEGWPVPGYPASLWSSGSLLRLPIRFYLPATLPAGSYRLIAGVMDQAGEKSLPVELGELPIVRREASFALPQDPQHLLEPPVQFGTHARLIGYDLSSEVAGEPAPGMPANPTTDELSVVLYWEMLQPLLPPHQVFVQLTGADGTILSQDDGVPGRRATAAPSGSWLPGEILVDPHLLTLPGDETNLGALTVQVGLYQGQTGVRLPALRDDEAIGDAAALPLGESLPER